MNRLEVKIGGRIFFLRFGYGCFRRLAGQWGVTGLKGVVERLSAAGGEGDLSFDQMELFIDLAESAVYAHGSPGDIEAFDRDSFGDALLSDPQLVSGLVQGLMGSLPQLKAGEDSGKGKAAKAEPELPN